MNARNSLAFLVAVLVMACGGDAAFSQHREVPRPGKGYNWKAAAKEHGLGNKTIAQIERDKFCVTNEAFAQVFTPYIFAGLPLFVTSDSVLNGYHVLFEESVRRVECKHARQMPAVLRSLAKNLPAVDKDFQGNAMLAAASKRRATLVLAVAMRLLGDASLKLDAESEALVTVEVRRIESGVGHDKPAWLGPPDRGFLSVDYSRYKPRGFYTKTPELQRYFRALGWLQSIPFRVEKDEELVAILMLGHAANLQRWDSDAMEGVSVGGFFRAYSALIGCGDDWDIVDAANDAGSGVSLAAEGIADKRKGLFEKATRYDKKVRISDQLAFVPDEPGAVAEVAYRVVSAYRLPDAVLFQRTTDPREFKRACPDGLEVAAVLGSKFARDNLPPQDRDKLLATLDGCKGFLNEERLYAQYLRCLAALLAGPEPDSPKFMASERWQVKQCQSALAGWAQLRHAWVLQAKPDVEYLGMTELPPGFVEPEPEFYSRLAELVDRSERVLEEAGALEGDPQEVLSGVQKAVGVLEKLAREKDRRQVIEHLSVEEASSFEHGMRLLYVLQRGDGTDVADHEKAIAIQIAALRSLLARLEKGEKIEDQRLRSTLELMILDIKPLWRELGALCRRLEALSHKQLRGVPFNAEENRFLENYGRGLAAVMLYGGNAYLTPTDDAPRVADVFSNPNEGHCLLVGIARPRAIYVLYPCKDGEVLCRGAVLPYYEFRHPERLTDAQWKGLLDSKDRPPLPAWLRPIVSGGELSRPMLKKGE
jgi:hypothetical protein